MAEDLPTDRLRAAEVVAMRLGRLLEDLGKQLLALPKWYPATKKRARMQGHIDAGLEWWDAWRETFTSSNNEEAPQLAG